MAEAKKTFVNLQDGPVTIFTEERRPLTVHPWSRKSKAKDDAVFEVEGAHYEQFVSSAGPLYPKPAAAEAPAPKTAPTPPPAESKKAKSDEAPFPADGSAGKGGVEKPASADSASADAGPDTRGGKVKVSVKPKK